MFSWEIGWRCHAIKMIFILFILIPMVGTKRKKAENLYTRGA